MDIEPEVINGVDYVMRSRQNDTKPSSPSRIVRLRADGEISFIR